MWVRQTVTGVFVGERSNYGRFYGPEEAFACVGQTNSYGRFCGSEKRKQGQ